MEKKKLHKSSTDKALAGVCGGIGEYFGIDSVIVRLLFVLLCLGAGSGLLIYIVCALIMPDERKATESMNIYTDYTVRDEFGQETYYQDRAANYDGSYSADYNAYGSAPQGKDRRGGNRSLGIVLIGVAAVILLKYFIPRIPSALIAAGILLGLGCFFVFKKK